MVEVNVFLHVSSGAPNRLVEMCSLLRDPFLLFRFHAPLSRFVLIFHCVRPSTLGWNHNSVLKRLRCIKPKIGKSMQFR